jgi:hypothetical protein
VSNVPTLWALAAEHRALAWKLEQLDLDDQTIADTLAGESLALESKAQACVAVLGNLRSQASAYKQRAEQLAAHAKALENRAEWLTKYVRDAMQMAGISEIKGPDWVAKLRQSPERVVIDAESQVPWEYWREKVIKEIDKNALKEAIKAGDEGAQACAHLERGVSLVIK